MNPYWWQPSGTEDAESRLVRGLTRVMHCREATRGQHQARRNALRNEVAEAKVREAEAKEEQSMARFRALIADGPIQIQKRV